MNKIQIFILSALPILPLILIDYKLALIFLLLWLDKVPIGILSFPRLLGIEFTTISTLLLGILYGLLGAVFIFFLVPILDGVKQLFIKAEGEWPPFVPGFANIIDAVLVMASFMMAGQDIFILLIAILVIKYAAHFIKDRVYQKPFDVMIIPNFVFNMVVVVVSRDLILSLI